MNLSRAKRTGLWLSLAAVLAVVLALVTLRPSLHGPDALHDSSGSAELAQAFGRTQAPAEGEDTDTEAPVDAAGERRSLHGQVLRPSGEPAPGALVTAQDAAGEVLFEAVADSGGLFAFEEMPDSVYVVEASLDGHGPALAIGVRPRAAPLRLTLQGGQDIFGIVTHDDEPVPGAVVQVGGPGTFPQRSVLADATGRFRLAGLRAGTYHFVATAEGQGLGSGFGGRILIDEASSEAERMEIPLRSAPELRLTLVDRASGEPVPEAVVTFSEESLHMLSINQSVVGGEHVVDFLPRGTYFLRVRAAGYLPWEQTIRIGARPGDLRVELRSGARVRGTVRDEAGNPVGRVAMSALIEEPDGGRWELRRSIFDDFHRLARPDGTFFWVPSLGFTTRPDGTFELSGLPAGEARIMAQRQGYAPVVSTPLQMRPDAVHEGLDFVLQQGRRIRGRVEGAAGAGMSGATVSMRPEGVPDWMPAASAVTGPTGMFTIEDVPSRVQISVRHPDFVAVDLNLDVPPDGLDDLIIRLSGDQLPAISGRVFQTTGAPAYGARVWLMRGRAELPVCRATVGPDGWFHAVNCTATPERILIAHADHAPLLSGLGGTLEARDWTLRRGGQVEFVSQRTPVVAELVPTFALPSALWTRPQVDMDRWSRHLVTEVAPGTYELRCKADGFDEHRVRIEVRHDERVEALCPSLERTVSYPLFVIDHMGAPVSGALVFIDGLDPPFRDATGDSGSIRFESAPGVWVVVEAMHEAWGRASMDLYVPWREPSDPLRIQLDQPISGEDEESAIEELLQWGVEAVPDQRAMVVAGVHPATPAAGSGLRRHDRLLWFRPVSELRYSIGVRRDGELLSFELVRAP